LGEDSTMLRDTEDPGSVVAFDSYPNGAANLLQPSWRTKARTTRRIWARVIRSAPATQRCNPLWMRTQRQGQVYQHLISDNGKDWRLVGSTTLPSPRKADPRRALHHPARPAGANVATMDNVSVSAESCSRTISPARPT